MNFSEEDIVVIGTPVYAGRIPNKVLPYVPPSKYYTPLREDGGPAKFLKAVPQTDQKMCIGCGLCREACPMGVIDTDPSITTGACIKCQACIKICPVGARSFDDEDFLSHRRYLLNNYRESVLCQLFF